MSNPKIKSELRFSNMISRNKQSGMTMISMMVIIVFLLFQAVIAMNVIPVYLTDSTVKNIMEGMATDPKVTKASKLELKSIVVKRLRMNNIYSIESDKITVKNSRDGYVIKIEYEPRGKLIGDLDYIVSFKHEAMVVKR